VTGFEVERELVDAFVAGRSGPAAEGALADRVARLLPFHWELPNPLAGSLSRITRRLGGEPALFDWLDRYSGRPRVTARLYRVIAVLDRLSAEPAVVTALRELRDAAPDPPVLAAHLPPATNHETLASLSYAIEACLADDRTGDAAELADAALALLRRVAARAAELEPKLSELDDELAEVEQSLRAALDTN
jgi:hypothetical protein